MSIILTVTGQPVPQGSKLAFVVQKKGGPARAVIVDNRKDALRAYRGDIRTAWEKTTLAVEPSTKPVHIFIDFMFERPQSHFGTGKNANQLKIGAPARHAQMPDIDKLARAVLDALTGYAFVDDRQVWSIEAKRHWASKPGTVIALQFDA